jgi:hypothetical protein
LTRGHAALASTRAAFAQRAASLARAAETQAILEDLTARMDLRLRVNADTIEMRARASYLQRERDRFLRLNRRAG